MIQLPRTGLKKIGSSRWARVKTDAGSSTKGPPNGLKASATDRRSVMSAPEGSVARWAKASLRTPVLKRVSGCSGDACSIGRDTASPRPVGAGLPRIAEPRPTEVMIGEGYFPLKGSPRPTADRIWATRRRPVTGGLAVVGRWMAWRRDRIARGPSTGLATGPRGPAAARAGGGPRGIDGRAVYAAPMSDRTQGAAGAPSPSEAAERPGMKPRSYEVTEGPTRAPARAMLRAVGMTDDDWDKPQVGGGLELERGHPVQPAARPAGQAGQGGRARRRRLPLRVRHHRRLRRHLHGPRGDAGLAGQPRGHLPTRSRR